MKTVLITGSEGFVGKNLRVALQNREDVRLLCFDVQDDPAILDALLDQADFVFHLAGVNRPEHTDEFYLGNSGLTERICLRLTASGRKASLLLSSSTQAQLDNPYGNSKREAEKAVFAYGRKAGTPVHVYRLTNVFGKWSRPNYNSVVSTFCHNVAHNLDIIISDPACELELVYIDDVVAAFIADLDGMVPKSDEHLTVGPTYRITLGELARHIHMFRDIRTTLFVPDLSDDLTRKLHATYLSFLATDDFAYNLTTKTDSRGTLAELIKSEQFGQIFVSRTHPGITRGNHHHHSKVEKFCVLQGDAVIRFRHVLNDEALEYRVSGDDFRVVDIPPGYTHHIENVSTEELIVLFWANQIFDPKQPDTYHCEVQP